MDIDTDALAQKLYDRLLTAYEVQFKDVLPALQGAFPGVDALDEPERFRWFLIEKFPVKDFGITIEEMLKEAGSPRTDDFWRHNRIIDLLESGNPVWPAFATADGIVLDGYHRIAAHRTLKHPNMSVVVAVRKPGPRVMMWDEMWNEAFPIIVPKLYHGTLVKYVPEILEKGIEEAEGWGGASTVGAFLSGTPQGALYWAKMKHQMMNDERVEVHIFDRDHGHEADNLLAVLLVEVPSSEEYRLKADQEQFEDVMADFSPNDWRQSLEKIGDVRFDGSIPPGWIRGVIRPSQIK